MANLDTEIEQTMTARVIYIMFDMLFYQVRNGMNTTLHGHEVIALTFLCSLNKEGEEQNKNIMGLRREIAIVKA